MVFRYIIEKIIYFYSLVIISSKIYFQIKL